MVELVYTPDSKPGSSECRFESCYGYINTDMKYSNIFEVSYLGRSKAIAFLQDAIKQEEEYSDDEYAYDDDSEALLDVYRAAIEQIKAGQVVNYEDIEKIGDDIYDATAGGGMYGDTDLSGEIQQSLAEILHINHEE